MSEEVKKALFEKMLELEHLGERKTYDGRNYAEQANGAFKMLSILGLDNEYIEWSYKK